MIPFNIYIGKWRSLAQDLDSTQNCSEGRASARNKRKVPGWRVQRPVDIILHSNYYIISISWPSLAGFHSKHSSVFDIF